jgi:cell division protein FtsZ
VLINITGSYDLTLFELDEAANKIREKVDPEANIIVGSTLDTGMDGKMRVSVVATGIDAAVKSSDLPLPRRSMAAPLKPQAQVEAAPEPTPAPVAAPIAATVAAAAPVAAPAPVAAAAPEQTLFDSMDDARAVEPIEDDFADIHEALAETDDLPPPAYTPRAEPQFDDAEAFVAPRAPAAGTPSTEAMARLQAAVSKAPGYAPQPAAAPAAAEEDRPRFGINSLINRMTGAAAEAQPQREQPQVTPIHEEPAAEADPEQERIEIPAFLRRQAN